MSEIEVEIKTVGGDRFKSFSVPSDSKIIDLLEKLEQQPEVIVVKRNGKIISEHEKLKDGDKLTIIPVVSGG